MNIDWINEKNKIKCQVIEQVYCEIEFKHCERKVGTVLKSNNTGESFVKWLFYRIMPIVGITIERIYRESEEKKNIEINLLNNNNLEFYMVLNV